MKQQFINNVIIILTILWTLYVVIHIVTYVINVINKSETKPISYPEEIQAVRAGDTLYVSSVSDSIYIGFKPLNK
jgi:uncharacterized membrane protein